MTDILIQQKQLNINFLVPVITKSATVIPAISATVDMVINATNSMRLNQVYIVNDGISQMTCTITTITDDTNITVTNIGAVGDVSGTLSAGASVYLNSGHIVIARAAASPLAFTIPDGDVDITINVLDGSSGGTTISLPANPTIGQTIDIRPSTDAATNNINISRNSNTINGGSSDPAALSINRSFATASTGYTFTAISISDWIM